MPASLPRLSLDERRRRIGVRHALAPAAQVGTATDAARAVVVLHATDPTSVFLAARARMRSPTVAGIERELYDDRSHVRMLAMRRTMFTVPTDDVPLVQAAATAGVARDERRRLVARLEAHGVAPAGEGERWVAGVEDAGPVSRAGRSRWGGTRGRTARTPTRSPAAPAR